LRNMVTSLFRHEQLVTTDAKAKEVRPLAEKMITLAKRGDLHARRKALGYLQDKATVHKLFGEIKDRYLDRQGGYVRIIKKGTRKGDAAPVSIIQLLPGKDSSTKKKSKGKEGAEPKGQLEKAVKKEEVQPEKNEGSSAQENSDKE